MGLSANEKKVLIDLARKALTDFVRHGIRVNTVIDGEGLPRSLMEKKGVFVAIYMCGEPRGCMGTVLPVLPIWEACMENARNAAYKDPRHVPLTIRDLGLISFEITILEAPSPFLEGTRIVKDIHGLILTKGFRREVFLPGVLRGMPCDGKYIFEQLRAKADMDDDKAPEEWEIFDAEVISERAEVDKR